MTAPRTDSYTHLGQGKGLSWSTELIVGRPDYSPLLRRKFYYGWWVLLVTALAVFFQVGAGNWTITVLIEPMTDEFNASHAQFVGALTVAAMLGAVVSPFIGRIVDRYGARVVITACLLFFGLMLILTSQINALWQFYLTYSVGMGLAQSGVLMVGGQVVAANWFIRKRGIAFATLFAATSVTGIVFTLIAQEIVDWRDWRMVWLTMGLSIILVPAPLAWLVIKRRPEDIGLRPDGDEDPIPVRAGREAAPRETRNPPTVATEVSWTLKEASRTRTFWLLNFSLLLIIFPGAGIITVMHPYFTDEGLSSGTAARLVSFYAFSSLIGTVFWGTLAQLLSVRLLLVPWALSYGVSITLLVLAGGSSVALIYLTLIPLGISVIGGGQLANQVWADFYGRRNIGAILGFSNLIRTFAIALGPLLAAGIRDTWGDYGIAFSLFAGFCFVAAVGLFFAKPPQKTSSTMNASL